MIYRKKLECCMLSGDRRISQLVMIRSFVFLCVPLFSYHLRIHFIWNPWMFTDLMSLISLFTCLHFNYINISANSSSSSWHLHSCFPGLVWRIFLYQEVHECGANPSRVLRIATGILQQEEGLHGRHVGCRIAETWQSSEIYLWKDWWPDQYRYVVVTIWPVCHHGLSF